MELEQEVGQTKWFQEHEWKIKWKNLGEISELWVTWNQYNIALTLIMFDFVAQIKRDIMLDVSIQKDLNQQRVFIINSSDILELVVYLFEFIHEWNIQPSEDTISKSDIIPDELWYEF